MVCVGVYERTCVNRTDAVDALIIFVIDMSKVIEEAEEARDAGS